MTSTTFSHASPPNPTTEDGLTSQMQPQPKKRAVLAEAPRKGGASTITTTGTRTSRARNGSGQAAPASSSSTNSGPTHACVASSSRPAPPNARLQIFQDPAPGAQEEDGENEPPEPETPTPWAELGTRVSRVKENVPEVKKMRGTTLRAGGSRGTGVARTVARAGGSRLEIFRDPEQDVGAGSVLKDEGQHIGEGAQSMANGAGPSSNSAGKAAFAPFRDDATATTDKPKTSAKTSSSRTTTKIPTPATRSKPIFAPFVDPGADSEAKSAPTDKGKTATKAKPSTAHTRSASASTSKTSTSSKAAFVPFVDPGKEADTIPVDKGKSRVTSNSSSKDKAKAKASTPTFAPFVDSDATVTRSKSKVSMASLPSVPKSKPAFVPFKDPALDGDDDDDGGATKPSIMKATTSFVPFIDVPEENATSSKGNEKEKEKKVQIVPVTPAKPTFMPFRDEVSLVDSIHLTRNPVLLPCCPVVERRALTAIGPISAYFTYDCC